VKIRFAEFRLDTDTRQLFRDDEEQRLTPKALDLLTLLVTNRPNALSKAELHERLWPATFVAEANLANVVAEIRDVLGDSAQRPRFIRTVHRFGYAFAADVHGEAARHRRRSGDMICWLMFRTLNVALDDGEHLVGRGPDAAVSLPSASVSRHHARIIVTRQAVIVEDLGSKNGTWVRGKRIKKPNVLTDGDDIRFGSTRVKFRTRPVAGTAETPRIRS
jgi:DNA-binding winged helix-turn-helix (wHTH) protein